MCVWDIFSHTHQRTAASNCHKSPGLSLSYDDAYLCLQLGQLLPCDPKAQGHLADLWILDNPLDQQDPAHLTKCHNI